jgi:hypothetical protein
VSWDGRFGILELSAVASADFEQHARLLHGGLRPGLDLQLSRRSRKQPLRVEIVGQRSVSNAVPLTVLASRVLALYHMPPANPGESVESYGERIAAIAAKRNERLGEALTHRSAS